MRWRAALSAALLTAALIVEASSAIAPTKVEPAPRDLFRPVPVPTLSPTLSPSPTARRDQKIYEPARRVPETRPPVEQPEVRAKIEIKTTGNRAAGVPTYYCRAGVSRCTRGYPDVAGDQMYAAAGPSLRVGDWRGRVVNVTANGVTVQVKLIDWCACGGDHFIDLYYDAFKLLGRPSRATVTW